MGPAARSRQALALAHVGGHNLGILPRLLPDRLCFSPGTTPGVGRGEPPAPLALAPLLRWPGAGSGLAGWWAGWAGGELGWVRLGWGELGWGR